MDELQAGRELDAAVAQALGHCPHDLEKTIHWSEDGCGEVCHKCKHCHETFWGLAYRKGYHVAPYSTDIAAAWEVIEKLCKDGYFPGVGYDASGWEAWVFFEEPIEGDLFGECVKVFAETAPLAICRAALKAIEAKEMNKCR